MARNRASVQSGRDNGARAYRAIQGSGGVPKSREEG